MTNEKTTAWKRKDRIRTFLLLLPLLLADAFGIYCTGCCTATVLNGQFGSKTSRFEYLAYNFSRDRRAIVVTSTRFTEYHYAMPSHTAILDTVRTVSSAWEKRIPLDPMPDGMIRCRVTVEEDPDAPLYESYDRSSFETEIDSLPISADETLHVRVRPNQLYLLSHPFRVKLIPRNGMPAADGTLAAGQRPPRKEEAGSPSNEPEGEVRIMFPVASDGNTYEVLTPIPRETRPNPVRELINEIGRRKMEESNIKAPDSLVSTVITLFAFSRGALRRVRGDHRAFLEQAAEEWDMREAERYRYPFLEEQEETRMIEYERIVEKRFPSWDAVLWKALWLPTALVIDTLLLPVYIVFNVIAYFGFLVVASAIQ